jgi:uncharacterized protein (TIGR03067 family)
VRTFVTVAGALALLVGSALSCRADEKAAARELKRDQGTWKFVSVVINGNAVPKEKMKDWRLVIKGNSWALHEGKEVTLKGTYQIEEVVGKVRRTIVRVTKGTPKKQELLGISEVKGDTRRGCLAKQGSPRPTAFSSKPGSGHILLTYKRVAP